MDQEDHFSEKRRIVSTLLEFEMSKRTNRVRTKPSIEWHEARGT